MSRSNLTDAVSAIDRCSDDELRQLQALISVRLNEGVPGKTRRPRGQEIDGGKKGGKSSKQTGSGKPLKKGNPQRKSQYATHPVYRAYKAAKMAAEKASKEGKIPFKDLAGEIREKYDEALSNWLQTKSGFRASKREDESSDSESEADQKVKGSEGGDASALVQVKPGKDAPDQPAKKRARTEGGEEDTPQGKYSNPPESWTPADGESWSSLSRQERRRIHKVVSEQHDADMQGG